MSTPEVPGPTAAHTTHRLHVRWMVVILIAGALVAVIVGAVLARKSSDVPQLKGWGLGQASGSTLADSSNPPGYHPDKIRASRSPLRASLVSGHFVDVSNISMFLPTGWGVDHADSCDLTFSSKKGLLQGLDCRVKPAQSSLSLLQARASQIGQKTPNLTICSKATQVSLGMPPQKGYAEVLCFALTSNGGGSVPVYLLQYASTSHSGTIAHIYEALGSRANFDADFKAYVGAVGSNIHWKVR